jgi:hypothetical protein
MWLHGRSGSGNISQVMGYPQVGSPGYPQILGTFGLLTGRLLIVTGVMSAVAIRANQLVSSALDALGDADRAQSDGEVENWIDQSRLVELAQSVRLVSVRDQVCFDMKPESARAHIALWLQVAAAAPPEATAAPLALAAFSAWMAGERSVFKCVLERGLSLDPDYRLFSLLMHAYVHSLPPAKWKELHMSP